MDPNVLIALWSGRLPDGFVPPAIPDEDLATCCQKRCRNKVAIKRDGTPARSCQRCLDRRAASCRRRRAALTADGGCRRCAYRKRAEGDFLCERCRGERDVERAQKRQDAIDSAAPRRVRRAARARPRGEQPRLRRQPLERPQAPRGQRQLLVAQPGSSPHPRSGSRHLSPLPALLTRRGPPVPQRAGGPRHAANPPQQGRPAPTTAAWRRSRRFRPAARPAPESPPRA